MCARVCVYAGHVICFGFFFFFFLFLPVKHERVYHCVYYCSLVCQRFCFVFLTVFFFFFANKQVALNPHCGPNTVFVRPPTVEVMENLLSFELELPVWKH